MNDIKKARKKTLKALKATLFVDYSGTWVLRMRVSVAYLLIGMWWLELRSH